MTKGRAAFPLSVVAEQSLLGRRPITSPVEMTTGRQGAPREGSCYTRAFPQLLSMKTPPSPLSSRPKRSAVERSLCGCFTLEMFFFCRAKPQLLRAVPAHAVPFPKAELLADYNHALRKRPAVPRMERWSVRPAK